MQKCTLPLTGLACVDLVITELGVFAVNKDRSEFHVVELAEGHTLPDVQAKTAARLVMV